MHTILLSTGLICLLLAAALGILFWNERRLLHSRLRSEHQRALGLPDGELVYEDADGQGEPLSSSEFPLVGKPDYVVQLPDGRPVPIALKPNVHDATVPYASHQIQVAAYCLILEDYFEQAPTHGILRYAEREFTVEYTPATRRKVIRLLGQMALCSAQEPPPLARQSVSKCRVCPFQPICPVGREKEK
jgi:CRISPR-associated exonuclease Cas4